MKIIIIIVTIGLLCGYWYCVCKSHDKTKSLGLTLLSHLHQQYDEDQTFDDKIVHTIQKADQEFTNMQDVITIAQNMLYTGNHFKLEINSAISMIRTLEVDYYDLQRNSIHVLYQERDVLLTIGQMYPTMWNNVISGNDDKYDKMVNLLETKVSKFRTTVTDIIVREQQFIQKAHLVETKLMEKSIQISNPNTFLDQLQVYVTSVGGMVSIPSIMYNCGTTPWCFVKMISTVVLLESNAYLQHKKLRKLEQNSVDASSIMVNLSVVLSDIIQYLQIRVKQYDALVYDLRQLNQMEQQDSMTLQEIKNKVDGVILKLNMFLQI